MKKIKSILAISSLGVLSIGTAAAIVGCNKTSNTDVELVSLAANGTPGIETTTKLTLTTNINIKNLKKDDITITDTNTSTKLTVGTIKLISDTTYDINITGTWGNGDVVSITINKKGYTFVGSPNVKINKDDNIHVQLKSLTADGASGDQTTTELFLDTDKTIANLVIADITVKNDTSSKTLTVDKVTFTTSPTYTIAIDGEWNDSDIASITIKKTGYTFTGSPTTKLNKTSV